MTIEALIAAFSAGYVAGWMVCSRWMWDFLIKLYVPEKLKRNRKH